MPRPLSSWSIGPPQLHLTSVPPFIDEGTFMKDTRMLLLLLLRFDHVCLSMEKQAQDSFGHTWYLSFFTQRNLRPRNFTLESPLICDKICPATKLCTKFYTLCHILHCIAIFSCSNWKILHLAKISTQPAVVMVVTNIKCAFGLSFLFFIASLYHSQSTHVTFCLFPCLELFFMQ